MNNRKFLPEVKRNRWLTNWARVRLRQKQIDISGGEPRTRFPRIRLVPLVACCSVPFILATVWLVPQISGHNQTKLILSAVAVESEAPVLGASEEKAKTEKQQCATDEFASRVRSIKVTRQLIPSISGYESISSQTFGGVIVSEYECETSSDADLYRVRWVLKNSAWEVKEISRPPVRRSGE